MAIGRYYILPIDDYSINGYWRLFLLMVIGDYFY
jgi:hypothetical protein